MTAGDNGILNFHTALAKLVYAGNQYHAVLYRNSKQSDKTNCRRNGEVLSHYKKTNYSADQRKRYIYHNQQSAFYISESHKQHKENHKDDYRNNNRQACHRPDLVFELAAVLDIISV